MKIEHALSIVTFDGKDFGEHGLQPQVLPFRLGRFRLQKFPVRIGLQFDQVRRRDDLYYLSEIYSFCCSRWHLDLFKVAGDSARPMFLLTTQGKYSAFNSELACT
jgi:hypothetical protein